MNILLCSYYYEGDPGMFRIFDFYLKKNSKNTIYVLNIYYYEGDPGMFRILDLYSKKNRSMWEKYVYELTCLLMAQILSQPMLTTDRDDP